MAIGNACNRNYVLFGDLGLTLNLKKYGIPKRDYKSFNKILTWKTVVKLFSANVLTIMAF